MKLISLEQLAQKTPMDTILMGVKEYVDNIEINHLPSGKITPLEMADSIESFCERAIKLVSPVRHGNSIDLVYEKTDILTWANLGLYFAHKLRSSVAYQQFVSSRDADFHKQAVLHLEKATTCWKEVSLLTSDLYKTVPLQHYNRNEDKYFHWNKVYEEVKDELEWLRELDLSSAAN